MATGALPTALEQLARQQRGHLTRQQAVAAGLTLAQVRVRLERGDWQPRYPRVYRLAGAPDSWEADVVACLLAAGPEAVVSHGSAARLLGLTRPRRIARVELTVPYGARTKPGRRNDLPLTRALRVHRTRELGAGDLVRVDGLPVTTAVRTMIDLAARHQDHQIVALVDDVIGARLATRDRLFQRALELRLGRPRVQHIIDATQPGAEGTFYSWLERHTAGVFLANGIRGAEWNVAVAGGAAVLDVLFRDASLPLEVDGPRFHELPAARRKDAKRSNLLRRLDLHPLRFTYSDIVEEPERVVAEVRRALLEAGCAHLVS